MRAATLIPTPRMRLGIESRTNNTDAGSGSKAICPVSNVHTECGGGNSAEFRASPLTFASKHPTNSTDQTILRIAITGLFVPVACVLICLSYAVRARWELGHWATYDNPDPKNLGWPIHHSLILVSLLAIYPALILSILSSFWLLHRRMIIPGSLIIALAVLLWLGMTVLGQSKTGDEFAAWYLD